MQTLWQDLRYGARMLLKKPGFTLIAVLTLALGIGANTAIFSVINSLLLSPLPVERPDEVVAISRGDGTAPPASYPDYVYYRDHNQAFSGLAVSALAPLNFSGFEREQQAGVVTGELVSGNYFATLGVRAALGRMLAPEDDRSVGAHPVAVVSHRFWQTRLGADPQVIGKTLSLNGHGFTVIGVTPETFTGSLFTPAIWAPLAMQPQLIANAPELLRERRNHWLGLLGRLKPGIAPAQATTALNTLDRQLQQEYAQPDEQRDRTLSWLPTRGVTLPHLRRRIAMISTLATLVTGSVLLIACANIASLLLARAVTRRKEIAVRLALGASRWRLVRQLLTESLLLACCGAGAGLLAAVWAMSLLMRFVTAAPAAWTFAPDFTLDARVFVFTLAVSLLAGVVMGLAPAWQASKPDLVAASRNDAAPATGRGARLFSLRGVLVSVQVAVSLLLLITTGLFIRSWQAAEKIDPGFETRNGLVMTLDLGLQGYGEPRGKQLQQELKARLAALPGVNAVTLASYVPLSPGDTLAEAHIEGREPAPTAEPDFVGSTAVDKDYLPTIGLALLRGRNFSNADVNTAPKIALINETLARRYWPTGDALGKRLRLGAAEAPWREVAGIVKDSAWRNLSDPPRAIVYTPLSQSYTPLISFVVRTAGEPSAVIADVRREVQRLDPDLPVQTLNTLTEHVSAALWPVRLGTSLLGIFGVLALTIAAVGLSGLVAFLVSQRTREIGIRLALGAQTSDVLQLVIGQGMKLVLCGMALGMLGAFFVTRLLKSLLVGVSATDPLTFALITLLLTGVALLACWIPARRATKVDPLIALRYE